MQKSLLCEVVISEITDCGVFVDYNQPAFCVTLPAFHRQIAYFLVAIVTDTILVPV